ncbi:hypothetical protein DNX69_02515 [Rhodopseudomonas palustris]|uniref:Uncharacterized protein n=1 Tax=Rhodopseudomonas palustris TaxID=1076 RepID=A0A323UJJ4_RHOPL|nr:hypothetical protein [Rhodopseudomonas palustris]PZA13272.1 hypothetical protein DNX69_02515 [Rhodopseudomonas palustris]
MDIKASGRSALVIAAGLTVGLWCVAPATPSLAAPQTAASDSGSAAKPSPKKKIVRHHAKPAKAKHSAAKPVVKSPVDEDRAANTPQTEPKPLADASGALPASIANAHAEATPAEVGSSQTGAAAEPAKQAEAPSATPSAPEVIAADQVNDLDRAATDAAQMQAQVQPQQPAANEAATVAQAQPQAQATEHDDAWDKASLIGKIFIAAGGLLTLASAARMFMA